MQWKDISCGGYTSGVSSLDGKILGIAFKADLTVSVQCEKLGTVLYPGKDLQEK